MSSGRSCCDAAVRSTRHARVSRRKLRAVSRGSLWALFCLFIIYGTTIPFHFTSDLSAVQEHLQRVTLNPFLSPATGRRVSIPDAVQNVLLFVPFGVLGVLASRVPGTMLRIAWVTLLGAALSVSVEALQLFTTDRVTATSDVLANTVGGLLGALAANTVDRAGRFLTRAAQRAGLTQNPAFFPFVAATVLIGVAALEPFDVTLEIGTVGSKLHALSRDIWQAGVLTDEGIATVHYALFGLATCLWFEAVRWRGVALRAAAIGVTLAVGLEASQIVITSRMPSLEDALVRAAGALVGVALWPLTRAHPVRSFWLGMLVGGTAVGAAMQQLSPFEIAPAYRQFGLMPFLSDYQHTTFETLSHVFELVLLYAPLGFVWRLLVPSRRTLWWSLVVTLLIAAPVEYLQGWIVGRYPDVTDIAISLGGAWLGFRLAGRQGSDYLRTSLPQR